MPDQSGTIPYTISEKSGFSYGDGSDEALGGSEWIQVFAQTPDLYKTFVDFYYTHIMTDAYGISVKLTELVRHKVAQINECHL